MENNVSIQHLSDYVKQVMDLKEFYDVIVIFQAEQHLWKCNTNRNCVANSFASHMYWHTICGSPLGNKSEVCYIMF